MRTLSAGECLRVRTVYDTTLTSFTLRFTGPGIVYIQTRNPETLGGWINDRVSPPDVYHVVAKTLVPGS